MGITPITKQNDVSVTENIKDKNVKKTKLCNSEILANLD